jgi:hypothetical protein
MRAAQAAEEAPRGERPEQAPSRFDRFVPAILIAGFLVNFAWRFWLSRTITIPIGHTDEDSYLNVARAIAGGPAGWSSENGLLRRLGYPMLISPAFLGDLPFTASYRIVQGINAALNATLLPIAYAAARSMLGFDRRKAVLISLAVALTASAVYYSELALTDAVLAPLTVGWLLILHRWISRPESWRLAIGSAAVAGVYYMVHVRGVVIVGVHLAVALLLAYRKRTPWRSVGLASLVVAGFAVFNQVVVVLLGDKVDIGGANPGGQTLRQIATLTGAKNLVIMIGTQLWYAGVVTFGFAFLAWLFTVHLVRRRHEDRGEETALRWTLITALVTTVGVVVSSAVILSGTSAAALDLLYGRYVSAFSPFWLLVGVGVAVTIARRTLLAWGAVTAAGLLAGAVVTQARMDRAAEHGRQLRSGLFTGPDLLSMSNSWHGVHPFLAVAVAVGVLALTATFVRTHRFAAVASAALAAANIAIVVGLVAPTEKLVHESTPVRSLAQLGVREGDTVATTYGYNYFIRLNLQNEVTWSYARAFGQVPPAGAKYVIGAYVPGQEAHWDGTAHGFRLVEAFPVETFPGQGWALWRAEPATN